MRNNFLDTLRVVLDTSNIHPADKARIIAEMAKRARTRTRDKHKVADLQWQALLSTVRKVRATHVSNRVRWSDANRALFVEYESLLDKTIARIIRGQEYATVNSMDVDAYAAHLRAEGKDTHGTCDKHWYNWIPDHVRKAFIAKTDAHYVAHRYRKGSRLRPFMSQADITATQQRAERLRTTFDNVRRAVGTVGCIDGDRTTSDTPRGALYLCAVRQAELALRRLVKADTGVLPELPVNWLALLSPEMRERLRAADASPTSVDTSDLHHFYIVHPNADHEAQAEIEASIAAGGWSAASSNHETPTQGEE